MDIYQKGRRFRVVREGARLSGMQPHPSGALVGWSVPLLVDTVLTCLGTSWTRGDGVPAVKWGDCNGKPLAIDCIFFPVQGGMWDGRKPLPGYLEPEG